MLEESMILTGFMNLGFKCAVEGKGKGKGECHNCGSSGHFARDFHHPQETWARAKAREFAKKCITRKSAGREIKKQGRLCKIGRGRVVKGINLAS